jgi:hypothetical protein
MEIGNLVLHVPEKCIDSIVIVLIVANIFLLQLHVYFVYQFEVLHHFAATR